jgi:peptide-methionine (S)-S-oxide reductase
MLLAKKLKMLKLYLMAILLNSYATMKTETAILAGGCFWCTETIFNQLKGVESVAPGYTGGEKADPTYKEVCTGETGHAEVVKIVFNPEVVSFEQLLDVFFEIHDPTTLNRQGADVGTQYRSAIFYTNENQKETAEKKISELNQKKFSKQNIVTEVTRFDTFYVAENYHHDYYNNNNHQPYCRFVISPKVEKFNSKFGHLK